jgi:hypothetical protein
MEANDQFHVPAALTPGKNPPPHTSRAGLDALAKRGKNPITAPARNGTPVAQPVAQSLSMLSAVQRPFYNHLHLQLLFGFDSVKF